MMTQDTTFNPEVAAAPTQHATDLQQKNWLPRGSSLISRSGKLYQKGKPSITAILQAATGKMGYDSKSDPDYYCPTLQSVEDSISNSFILMKANGGARMAVPFLASGIFMGFIGTDKPTLAATIVEACMKASPSKDFVIVTYPDPSNPTADYNIFLSYLKSKYPAEDDSKLLMNGDIVDFQMHQCDMIMNAANMQVTFGGGISGAIANATQEKTKIDQEAHTAITAYWNAYSG